MKQLNQTNVVLQYQHQLESVIKHTPYDWLKQHRNTAFDAFMAQGIPSTRTESWKYTPLRLWERKQFFKKNNAAAKREFYEIQLFSMLDENSYDIVFIDGEYYPSLGNHHPCPEMMLIPFAQALKQYPSEMQEYLGQALQLNQHPFASLCAALAEQGMVIIVPENVQYTKPIHLLFASSQGSEDCATHLRNLIVVGKNSQIEIIEHYVDLNDVAYFNNVVTEAILLPGATLSHYKIEQEGNHSFHIGSLHVKQATGSNFNSHAVTLSGNFSRHDITTNLCEPHASCVLNGLYFPHNTQHVDYHTRVVHAAPNCNSHSLYKGVLAGKSVSVFNGAVLVEKDAQKTSASQANHNLLLSLGCEANSKPELEIYADDVKCAHGATSGQLDLEALFFLQARGITIEKARRMLIRAFANEVFNKMPSTIVRDYCQRYLEMAAYE